MTMSPLQALWIATEAVHEETDSYGSNQDTYYVNHFLDLSVGVTPELATRIASIPIANFTVQNPFNSASCWQRIERRLNNNLADQNWNNIVLLGDLSLAIQFAARDAV